MECGGVLQHPTSQVGLSHLPDCRDERGEYYLDLKIYSSWFNVYQPVPQPSRSEQLFQCWYENTYFCTHAHAFTTNTLCFSVIPVFPGVDLEVHNPSTCAVFPPRALWKPVPDIDLSDRCDHMLTQRVLELHHSFPFTFPLAACGGVHCSFMDHCSVNLGHNKKEAHGRGMLCAITANDMPPCKLWP